MAVQHLEAVGGRPVTSLRRLGKRIVFVLADELFTVLHLMIAGRLWWRPLGDAIPKKRGLAAFDFLTQRLKDEEVTRLHAAARDTLAGWVERLHLDVMTASPRRSRPFGRVWQSTAAISNHGRPAAHPCSGSCTQVPRSTTARPVRPTAGSWLTGRCRSYSGATGHGHSRSGRSVDSPKLWR